MPKKAKTNEEWREEFEVLILQGLCGPTPEWRKLHKRYKSSVAWRKVKRSQKLEDHSGVCVCGTTENVNTVHHRTYDRLGDELMEDLYVLCKKCHFKHEKGFTIRHIETGEIISQEDLVGDESRSHSYTSFPIPSTDYECIHIEGSSGYGSFRPVVPEDHWAHNMDFLFSSFGEHEYFCDIKYVPDGTPNSEKRGLKSVVLMCRLPNEPPTGINIGDFDHHFDHYE